MENKTAKEGVREFLNKEGYPLEMYVAKCFRANGFQVNQGSIYLDAETKKDREIDVLAYFGRYYKEYIINFRVIIECKYAKYPWVLFSQENPFLEGITLDHFYCSDVGGRVLLERLAMTPNFMLPTRFMLTKKAGYGLTDISSKNEMKVTHKAISTLLNSLIFERERTEEPKNITILIPIIVIQGQLFEAYLNDSDEIETNEIEEGQLIYKSNISPNVFPKIEIIKKEKVEALAAHLKDDFSYIFNKPEIMEEIVSKVKSITDVSIH